MSDAAMPAAIAAHDEGSIHSVQSISARIERIPATRSTWKMVVMLSIAGFFEMYELTMTGAIAPGLVADGILAPASGRLLDYTGVAGFVASTFAGLFVGTCLLSFVVDRFGRRLIFTTALLLYAAAGMIMSLQTEPSAVMFWRFVMGIGIGIELVTIDAYLSELVPRSIRGRAFALSSFIQYAAVPVMALLAVFLVPNEIAGVAGWRVLVWVGSLSAIAIWFIRRHVPESPRWLASHGRFEEADVLVRRMEAAAVAVHGPLPDPIPQPPPATGGRVIEIFKGTYAQRTLMLSLFQILQAAGAYGFTNWLPTILVREGINITHSLTYTFAIALMTPIGPLVGTWVADRFERKSLIMFSATGFGLAGLVFGFANDVAVFIAAGMAMQLMGGTMAYAFHAYQAELYPTRIRAVGIGFTYSWSRLSVMVTAFPLAYLVTHSGKVGALLFIAISLLLIAPVVGLLGPRTRNRSLEEISD